MFRGDAAHRGVYRGGGGSLGGLGWRAPTDGDVVSSPTIANGVVYVGSGDGFLYALDLATGARRWRVDAKSPVSSSPAVGGGMVFAAARDGSVIAVDASTGATRWRFATGPLLPLPWGHESGDYYISSPVYVNGTIVVGAGDGRVYAADAESGRVRWTAKTEGRVRSSPAVAGGSVFVGSYDGRIYAFDLATGAQRWRYDTEGATLRSGSFGYDRRSIQSSPTVANGVVYVGARDGFLYAIDARDGHLRWRFDHHISWIITSPAFDDGVVYAGSSDGHFLQAVDTTGKELWRFTTDAIVWSSPAVAGAMVYVGDGAGRLHAIDRRTGAERWSFRSGASVLSSPSVSGDLVVFGSGDGGVYAVRANDGPAVQRVVFFDSAFLKAATVRQPEVTAQYLARRGYRIVDDAALGAFVRERVADRAPSVVVFAIDHPPASVMSDEGGAPLLRRYLRAGGKVVWIGKPPLIFPIEPATGRPPQMTEMNWTAPNGLLDVSHEAAIFDLRGVRVTPDGARWGLPARWRDSWSVGPQEVTKVLGADEWGLAAAWVKSYGGPEGTGFVRVPADDPLAIYLAAEYRGAR